MDEATRFLNSGVRLVTIASQLRDATPPYITWVVKRLERLVQDECFREPAQLQVRAMRNLPPLPGGMQAHVETRALGRVSGDLIVCAPIGKSVWFGVGDATGHGVAAGLFSGAAHQTLHNVLLDPEIHAHESPLEAALTRLNSEACADRVGNMALPGMFCRVVSGAQTLEVLNCGSPSSPSLLRSGKVHPITNGSAALGYFPRFPAM